MADKKNTVSFDEWANGAEVKPAKTGILGRAGDLGLSALKSAIAVPETAVGLANLVSGGKAGKAVESAGIRFKDAKDILDAQKSDAAKDTEWRFQNAEGFTGKLGAAVENPSLIANTLVESAAPMLAGGVVGRGLSIAAPRLAGYAGAIGEGAIGAGSAAEQIRQESTDGELSGKQAALAGASGLATGLLGYGGSKLAGRLGVGDIDTALAGGARTAGVQAGKEAPGMLKRIGGGALSEGVLEELPQSVSEQMLQNVALDRDPMQGVDAAAAMGLLSGGLMGGGMGVVSGQPNQQATPAQPPVAPTTPGAPPAATPPATPPAGPTLGQSLTGTPMADLMGGSGLTGGANPLQAGLSTLTSNNQMYPGMNTEPAGYTVDPDTGAIIPAEPVGARQVAAPAAQVEAPAPVAQAAPTFNNAAPVLDSRALYQAGVTPPATLDTARIDSMLADEPKRPSVAMGLNPEAGGLTAAAAIAVDSGASPVTAGMGLRALSGLTEVTPIERTAGQIGTPRRLGESPIIDVQAREVSDPELQGQQSRIGMTPRIGFDQPQGTIANATQATQTQQAAPQQQGTQSAIGGVQGGANAMPVAEGLGASSAPAVQGGPIPAVQVQQAAPAAVTGPASDVRARNLAALKERMMAGQTKPTTTTPPAPNQQATPAAEQEKPLPPSLSAKLQEAHRALGRDVTRSQVQRMRDSVAREVETGTTNNGGVIGKLTPKAVATRREQLQKLDADLALFDGQQATPAPEAGPTNQGATNGQRQETLLKAEQPTGAAAMVSGAPVAEQSSDDPLLNKLATGYGYQGGIDTMPYGLGKTARKLHKAIIQGDEKSAQEILHPDNKQSRKAFEKLFDGRVMLPSTVKGTKDIVKDFIGKVSAAVASNEATATTPSDTTKPGGLTEKAKKAAGKVDAPKADKPQVFKTADAADYARAGNPAMQKRKVKGGYILVERTAKQIAAAANNARKNFGNVNPDGGPLSAHQYIASEGGIATSAMDELGFDRNLKVGAKHLFTKNGMTLERMTEALQQAGYMDGTNQNEAIKLVSESAKGRPQYTADGWEQIAQADANVQFEDFMAAQEEMAQADDFDPFDSLAEAGFLEQDADAAGFYEQSEQIQNEISALQSSLESMNIDPVEISDSVHRANPQATQDEFYDRYKAALQQAIDAESAKEAKPASSGSARQDAGSQSGAGAQSEGLTSKVQPIDRVQLERDFRTYPTKVLEGVIANGGEKALLKAAGVKSAYAFDDLPVDDGAKAYVAYVEAGGAAVDGLPVDYNEWVRAQERDAESRRMQNTRTIRQENGKPFKSEDGARKEQDRFGLKATHKIAAVAGGFELQQMSIGEQIEARRIAEGRESYDEAQTAVLAEMGITGETPEGDIDATDAQWVEIERRVDARMRGEPILTSPTKADIEAKQARAEQAAKAKAAQDKADTARAAKERERKDVAAASVAAADTFELGQDAMANLTGQNDLQFSRAAAKEVRDLVTLHNLSEDNLMYAGKMGGIPVPSIGITKVETPFGGFGGITLIAPKDLIDPEAGVPVYDRDAWTARFPELNFKKIRAKLADALFERMSAARDLGGDGSQFMSMLWDQMRNASTQTPDKITSLFTRYSAPKMLYAQEVLGKAIKPQMRGIKPETLFGHTKTWRDFVAKSDTRNMTEQREREFNREAAVAARAAMTELGETRKEVADERTARMLDSSLKSYLDRYITEDGMNAGILDRALRDVKSFGQKEIDPMKMDEAVRKVVPLDDAGYKKWVAGLVEPLFEAPTITVRGSEVPVTLENVVEAMTIGKTAGAEKSMTFGVGKAASMLGKQFKSIDEIKAARDQVVSAASEKEGKNSTEALISEYQNHVSAFYTGKDWKGNIDTWAALDSSLEALTKAGRNPADGAMNIALQRSGFKRVDAKGISLAKQALEALRDATTDYFEAKPQRAVRLNEFKGAVVPKGTSAEAIALLEENGITIEVHGNAEGAREKAIQKLAKRLDGKTGSVIFSRAKEQPRTPAPTIRAAITKAYGNLLDKLEDKGLVTIAQTEREAIEAAAQARADKTGGDVEQIKRQMLASVQMQRVWHGTPHRFDKFSTEFMGKGEGAQAYGWGLYYASKREIAESYRGTLTYRDMVRKFRNAMPDDASIEDASEWADSGDAPKDMARVIKALSADDWLGFDYPAQALTALFKEPANFDISKELADAAKAMQGQLYEVEIPEDSDMLLWDKPLSEQPENVLAALRRGYEEQGGDYPDKSATPKTGREIYNDFRALAGGFESMDQRAASEYLASLGIKGIKYLDGTSRNAGDGSYNYVIFDGADTQIVDVKYSANGNIEGFFDKQTGKSFLVADNLTAASAPGTLMHEVGIHMAADGKLEPLFKRAGSLLKTGTQNEFIQRVKARMARAGETSDEEAAAYIVTEYESDRAKAPITIGKWLADLTAAVRAWLFSKSIILKAEQLTVADIAAVARANARSMARGGPNGGPGGGIRRSFAGEGAATADKMALATARQRVEAGENAETVRKETGWFKGVDGKWRFEISDSDASIKDRSKWTAKIDGLKSMRDAALRRKFEAEEKRNAFLRSRGESPSRISSETKREPEFKALVKALNTAELAVEKSRSNVFMAEQDGGLIKVGDVLDHLALFSAYPKISETRVAFDNGLQKGNAAYSPESNTITIPGMDDSKQLLTVLLHEIQHGIQNIEGFATGGSPDLNGGFSAYKRLAGEVESRNTEARQGMTDAQRRETAPSATADTPDSDVIVVFNGKDAMSAPAPANADSRTALPATLNIDGKDRPTTNSNGQPIHPTEEGVRNFWKWFADSRVVDERGRPLIQGGFYVKHASALFPSSVSQLINNAYDAGVNARRNGESVAPTWVYEQIPILLDADQQRERNIPEWVREKSDPVFDFQVFSAIQESFEAGRRGYGRPGMVVGKRLGAMPENGFSWNYRDGEAEKGVSVLGLVDPTKSDFQENTDQLSAAFMRDRNEHYVIGFENTRVLGSDDEDLVMAAIDLGRVGSQIKSATGNTGAFSPTDPDIRFSRAADMAGNAIDKAKQTADKAMGNDFPRAASMPDLNDDQRSLLGKVGASQSPASDAIKAATDRAGLKIRQGMVDRFAALKELDEKALGQNFIADSITNSAWVLAKMSSAGAGALNAMMKSGRIEMDAQQKVIGLKGDPNGGLTASLQKLGGPAEVERFFAWVAANRAEKLMGEGRENLFTPAEIAAGKTLNTGTTEGGKVRPALYSQVHAEFQQCRDDVLAIAEQAGIINGENRAMWRDEFYVPFYRVMEDDADRGRSGGSGLSRQEAYKKLKGGKQNLNDLMENTLMNFHHLLSASLKNQAAVQAIKNAEHVGIARKVPEARRDTKTSTFVLVDGKKVFYEVDDPLVFESITTLADPGLNNTAVRVMGAFKRLFTNMTTATPQFIIANTFRDLLQASATSPTSKNIAKNLKEGIQSYRDEKTRAEMLASGGAFSFGHIYGMGADEVKASLQKTVAGAGLISSPSMIPSILRKVWDAWSDVTDLSENASRAATYAQNVEQMGKLRAAFEARDVMDFSQHGAWPAVRLLVRIVPFLNARLQGLDKLYRSGVKPSILTAMGKGTDTDKQAAARFAMVTGALTLATMALYLVNADDDEYKKLEEWQKDTYWFIRIGENAFFLPKPFEVGAIATIAERTLQQAMDDKATGKLFRERMWEMLMQTFAFNPTPQMFQPLIDVYSNKDAFTGRDIESAGMERMSAGLRSRDSTTAPATALSAVSRVFGDESAVAVSPVQADHLIKGYLGGVGAMAAGWIDTMYRAATGQSSPDKAWSEYQPIRRFYRDLDVPVANTRYTTLFYDGLKEANRVYADVMELQKLGRPEDATTLAAEKRNVLQMRIALNAQQRRMTEINNRMKEVRRSDRDGEWKRRELDLLTTQKALITERMGKRIEDARVQ